MIEAVELGRRFGTFVAVEGVSFSVPDGTILALLGPNGAGKTTIVRMLTGVLALSSGRATVGGYDVGSAAGKVRARIGLVTDVPGLHEQMTAPAYLDFFGSIYGLTPKVSARRVEELLAFFELNDHKNERMVGFSKGMKQKVALARALIHEPAALFLDEPTSGLDPLSSRSVRELILTLKSARRSIILCTHDLDEAERLADEIAIVRRGRVVALGRPSELRESGTSDSTVTIELAGPCPGALAVLRDCALDLSITLIAQQSNARLPPSFSFRTARTVEVNPIVIQRLVAAGALIVSIECARRTLEDVYAEAVAGADD